MLHKGMSKAEAFEESVRMLEAVKIPELVSVLQCIRTNFLAVCVNV